MRKEELRMNEERKYRVIKELVDHDGNKRRAAVKLNISLRQVNRLIKIYQDKGKGGFVHGNRNRRPVNSLPQESTETIVNLYREKYQGYNFAHFTDKLNEDEGISVSYSSVYNILTDSGIESPKIQKETKKRNAKKRRLENKTEAVVEEAAACHQVALEDAHPRKERCKFFGEQGQMDGSKHVWFGNIKTTLHLCIDNCTGTVLSGWFEKEETLHGYYVILKQILMNYGIPYCLLTDNRTVFNYEKSSFKSDHTDVLTQFGYACKKLGITLKTSSVSQAKGQIERANGTFQGRLVNELRLHHIDTIDEANRYLLETFIPDFNRKFALDYRKFDSVMEKAPDEHDIDLILSVLSPRKFDNGSSIKYNNNYYQAVDENDTLCCFKPKTECLVINAFDGRLYVTVDDHVYALKKLDSHKSLSADFDSVVPKQEKKKKIYIPPMDHPWKRQSFLLHQQKAHDYHIFT